MKLLHRAAQDIHGRFIGIVRTTLEPLVPSLFVSALVPCSFHVFHVACLQGDTCLLYTSDAADETLNDDTDTGIIVVYNVDEKKPSDYG